MTLKELLDESIEQDFIDLQALIMFLVFEKQVLALDDSRDELGLYFLKKHRDRMNRELRAYKKKMKMQYKPNVFEIKIKPKRGYRTVYVLATDQIQAEAYCRSLLYEPISTSLCDDDLLMTQIINDEETTVRIKDLKNKKTPNLLGGF